MRSYLLCALLVALLFATVPPLMAAEPAAEHMVVLHTRNRVESPKGSGKFEVVQKEVRWDGRKTAIVICDMWDQHWCKGATARVAEMAPRMNDLITAARKKGVLIIHSPSGTLQAYKDTPQRKLAQAAPPVTPKVPLKGWCNLDPSREPPLPIDDSDGGCDDEPRCPSGGPWKREIATLKIEPGDAITDSAEAYYLVQQRGIENVIVMGVHTNMCVLGRPFGIRQMVYQGKNVVLVAGHDRHDVQQPPSAQREPLPRHGPGDRAHREILVPHHHQHRLPRRGAVPVQGGQVGS